MRSTLAPALMLGLVLASIPAMPAVTAEAASTRSPFPAESLWQWRFLADPQISPDGRHVVYTVVEVDRAKDAYRSDLWILDRQSGRTKPFTTHEAADSQPVWSPDGSRVAFVSARGGKPQIFVLDMSGGEARAVTAVEEGASQPAWSRDGRRIAFVSTTLTAEEKAAEEERKKAERQAREAPRRSPSEDGGEVEETAEEETVIEALIFRRDGSSGYRKEDRFRHVWVVEVGDSATPSAARRLTHGPYNHGDPAWSADGRALFLSGIRKPDADYLLGDSEIYRLDLDEQGDAVGDPVALTDHRGRDARPLVSPDGRWLAYLTTDTSEPPATHEQGELALMRPDGSEQRRLSATFDRSVGGGTGHDVAAPVGGGDRVRWLPDSSAVLFTSADRGQTHLYRATLGGLPVERLTSYHQGDAQHFSIAEDGTLAVIFSTPTQPFDLYTFPFYAVGLNPQQEWQRHTHLNDAVLAEHPAVGYETVTYPSFDERKIQGWVIRPPDFDAEQKYPAILYIHGGPHAMYGTTFFHEFQMLASAGYVVLITNPRGSTGYGLEFATAIQYAYPGDDVKDLMAGVDWLLEQGSVDPDRLGVAGGSGGGLLTSWIVGHTDRFAAAVAQRNVTSWRSFTGTSDVGYMSTRRWFEGPPWQDLGEYLRRSPLTYADRITTPLLLIHSDEDYRTPLEQSEQLYAALKMQKKPARLVVFPGESHGLSRGGRPSHRVARLNHILGWFDRYLKTR